MARLLARAQPVRERVLVPLRQDCPGCGGPMRLRYENRRTLVTLSGPVRLRLKIRRCEHEGCARHRVAAGGDPGALDDAVMRMVTAATIEHAEWFYAPVLRRLEHEERHLRAAGCWPPPLDRKKWPPIPPMV